MRDSAIEFRDVSFVTPQGRTLLDNINLRLEPGTTTALLGRSGSGKTTLLRTVNRMVEPTSGEVHVGGAANRVENPVKLRRSIGYVIQETGLFPHFTVERNVGTVLEIEGRPRQQISQRAREMIGLVGLSGEDFTTRYPHQLSGGQRQRVGVARALAADPAVLLMDEPFGALDPLTRAEMQEMLHGLLARLHKTTLIVTHDLEEALYLANRIVLLDGGRIVADVASQQFVSSEIPQIKEYVRAAHRGTSAGETGA